MEKSPEQSYQKEKSIVFPWKPITLSVSLILHILFLSRTPGNKTP